MRCYSRLFRYGFRHAGSWALILALTLAAAGLAALQPWPMKLLIDNALGKEPLPASVQWLLQIFEGGSTPTGLLLFIVIGGLVLFGLHSAVDAGLAWVWTAAGRRMVYELAADLFARLQRRSLVFHKRNSVADLMSRVTVDSWCVYQVAENLAFGPGNALLASAAMVVLMLQLDTGLTLLTLALAPAMVGASFLLGKRLRAAAELKREIESRIQAHIQQTLTGIPVVQAFGQEETGNLRLQTLADAAIRSQQRGALLGSINGLSSGLVATLGSGLILWLGARHVLAGSLSIGSLLVFLVYLNSLQAQIKILANVYTSLQGLNPGVQRVSQVLDSTPEPPEKPNALALTEIRGSVRFENVTVGYETGRPILKNVSLEAQAGQVLAIVGATGAGKTTLVNLIPRFMDPWSGRVLIDGHDLRDVRLETLRSQVGMVLQDSFLFPFSISENIAYGRPEASREEIQAAAIAANAHEFIRSLPEGYDTVIGERGATLSGGQRQRLAIARALLKNPRVLILDEPTSALDAESEKLILDALQKLMRGRTSFVIAHRLSTIRRADSIVVLQNGAIIETGKHENLLAQEGLYARWHRLQNIPENELVSGGKHSPDDPICSDGVTAQQEFERKPQPKTLPEA